MKPALILLFQIIATLALAQQEPTTYIPRTYYTTDELLTSFLKRKDVAIQESQSTKVSNHYILLFREMKRIADERGFLDDNETEVALERIMTKLIAANPQLKRPPQQVLILRNSYVNAQSYGEGTLAFTTGILSRIDSEPVLAFILAHEMSHYELDHVGKTIQKNANDKTNKKVRKGFEKIIVADKKVTTNDIDSLKKWVYSQSHYSRENETQADSLGFVIAKNAGYDTGAALTVITLLDSALVPKYHLGHLLEDSFNSTKVPFQDYWLSPRLSLFEHEQSILFFSSDSLKSHPDLPLRRQKLMELGCINELPLGKTSWLWNADLENIESAILQKRYDEALLLALTAIKEMPAYAPYLKGVVARILIDIYTLKEGPLMKQYVPSYIAGYSDDLKLVNAFLHNIHKEELGELAFDYINRKGNFNLEMEAHYYQLWRIANLTGRDELKTRVKQAYRDRFGKGEYFGKMENPIQIGLPRTIKPTDGN